MGTIAGMLLGIATLVAGIGAIWSLVATYTIGVWGIVIAVWLALTASSGWKHMQMLMYTGEARKPLLNPSIAATMVTMTFTMVGVRSILEPPIFSPWWGLLVPIVFLAMTFILQMLYEGMLNVLQPSARRK